MAGNADSDRIPIMEALVARAPELSVRLYGRGWSRSRPLKRVHATMVMGVEYSGAMCASTVCPCLVRRSNRDGHVMRSFELPAMGALMLAEWTDEHLELFDQDVHCAYWSCPEELADKARYLVGHPGIARKIAGKGHERVVSGGNTYADRAMGILHHLGHP
jgi:hypothetical protein